MSTFDITPYSLITLKYMFGSRVRPCLLVFMTSMFSHADSHIVIHIHLETHSVSKVELSQPNYNSCHFQSSHILLYQCRLCDIASHATLLANHTFILTTHISCMRFLVVQVSVITCNNVTILRQVFLHFYHRPGTYSQFSLDTEV